MFIMLVRGRARGGGEIHRLKRENELLILNLNSILSLRRGEGETSVSITMVPVKGLCDRSCRRNGCQESHLFL